MAYNPRTAIRRFGLTPEEEAMRNAATRDVMGSMRAPVSLPLSGPLPAGLADDDITDATVRGVRADQRAASTDAATSALTGQPPIIDLGDDAEFVVPREEPSNLFGLADDGTRTADYRPGRDGPILPATVLPNYVPGQPRGDTVLLSNVQPSPSGAPASRNLSSLPVTPMSRWRTAAGHYNLDPRNAGLADDDVDATGANEDRFIDRTRAAEGRSMSPVGTFTEPMVRGRASRSIARLPGGVIATPTSPSQSMDLGSPTMTRPARSTNPYTLPRLGLEFAATTPESRLVDFAGLADDDPDSVWTPQSYADGLTRVDPTTDADVSINPDDDVIGGDIEAESENATDIDADADLEVSEPLDPRRRAKLFGPAPQTTEYEDAAIRRGRELDQRAARGQRIAAGVAGGLGLLGLLTGSDVATGLGQAAAGAGGAIPTDVEEQMRARAEQRRVREQGGIDRENALVNADNEAMRQDAQDDQRAQMAESEMSVNAERARALQAEQADAEFERQALAGNADGMRAAIRARAAAVQHGPTRQAWEQRFADGGPLDQMTDLASLRTILAEVGDTDVRRGGQGAGGSGGGSRGSGSIDASGQRLAPPTRGRSGGGPRPTPTPATGPTESQAAPIVRETGQIPTDEQLAALPIDDPYAIIRAAAIAQGIDPTSPAGREHLRAEIYGYENAPSAAGQNDVLNLARAALRESAEAEAGGGPPGVAAADWALFRRNVDPVEASRREVETVRSSMQSIGRRAPRSLQLAIANLAQDPGSFSVTDLDPTAQRALSELGGYANRLLRERSGAAVTDQELRRMLTELSAGRYATAFGSGGIQGLLGALQRQEAAWERELDVMFRSADQRAVRHWVNRQWGAR